MNTLVPDNKSPRYISVTTEPVPPPPTPSSGEFHSPEVDPLLGRSESAGPEAAYVSEETAPVPPSEELESEESKTEAGITAEELLMNPKNDQVPLIPSMKSFSRSELLDSLMTGVRAVKVRFLCMFLDWSRQFVLIQLSPSFYTSAWAQRLAQGA
jgi:hypothetical protein